jgi:xanthine permease XanP
MGMSVELVPGILDKMPQLIHSIFASGISTGGITAIIANALIRVKEPKA